MRFDGIFWKVIGYLWFVVGLAIMYFSSEEYKKTNDYTMLIVFCCFIGAIEFALGTILLALNKIYNKIQNKS